MRMWQRANGWRNDRIGARVCAAALLSMAASAALAQSVPNASRGGRLFSGTQAFNVSNPPSACTACHTIENRRAAIVQSTGSLTYDNALARLNVAIGMFMQPYQDLPAQDRADLAGYLASLPSPEPAPAVDKPLLTFAAATVGVESIPQTVVLRNANTSSGAMAMTVASVAVSGTHAADFRISADACTGQTLASNGACSVAVTFRPGASGGRVAVLSLMHSATPSVTSVSLSGEGASAAPAGSGGGGGVPLAALLALFAAVGLRRRL